MHSTLTACRAHLQALGQMPYAVGGEDWQKASQALYSLNRLLEKLERQKEVYDSDTSWQ